MHIETADMAIRLYEYYLRIEKSTENARIKTLNHLLCALNMDQDSVPKDSLVNIQELAGEELKRIALANQRVHEFLGNQRDPDKPF